VELAELAGLTGVTVTRIEEGLAEPRPGTIRKLAHTLGREPHELMEAMNVS
jgi:transcriptional regulator with XRE-family HTH domain